MDLHSSSLSDAEFSIALSVLLPSLSETGMLWPDRVTMNNENSGENFAHILPQPS